MREFRRQIILDYARWTALSALRSGAPIKSRGDVYPLLDAIAFGRVLNPNAAIAEADFDAWHEMETAALCARDPRLPIGWGVKLINVYLKTAAYVGNLGHASLRAALHPPIDAGLWKGIRERFKERPNILEQVCCVGRIKDITDYRIYARIITGCRAAAQELGSSLMEVEHLWLASATPA
jgi:hypothetical protein